MSDEIEKILRQHGLQVTAQRLAICRAVCSRPHATADELTGDVRAVIGTVSRQAVYDTLGILVDKNLVRRIQPVGTAARYEERVGDNHHHLICRGCETIFDIDCAVGAAPCLHVDDDHGFEIDETEVIFWGRCPSCRKAAAQPKAVATTTNAATATLANPQGHSTTSLTATPDTTHSVRGKQHD